MVLVGGMGIGLGDVFRDCARIVIWSVRETGLTWGVG